MIMKEDPGSQALDALRAHFDDDDGATGNEPLAVAMDNLVVLWQHGALAGAADVIAHRRAQVELHGYSPQHDFEQHAAGSLVMMALARVLESMSGPTSEASQQEAFKQAAALLAAEADRSALHAAWLEAQHA